MDTIEHGMYLNQQPELLERMAANGQVLVPTLSGYYWVAGLGNAIDPATATSRSEMPPNLVELAHYNLDQGTRSMRDARQAGVRIGLGSDGETVSPGDTARELLRMVHHGLSPSEALRSATSVAAEAIGLQEHVGTVQAGKLADLVVIDGDALAQPELLLDPGRIWLVLQLGNPVAGTAQSTYREPDPRAESR
jgi:imidazolonepropionase-like amidohydrolase